MSGALQRGSVVLRAGRYGVVWLAEGAELVLHPVTRPSLRARTHDVALSLGELMAFGIVLPAAVVRCGSPIRVDREGQALVGAVIGLAVCRISLAVARAAADHAIERVWEDERRHRRVVQSMPPVRMDD